MGFSKNRLDPSSRLDPKSKFLGVDFHSGLLMLASNRSVVDRGTHELGE
jgi:hypothetical protein